MNTLHLNNVLVFVSSNYINNFYCIVFMLILPINPNDLNKSVK